MPKDLEVTLGAAVSEHSASINVFVFNCKSEPSLFEPRLPPSVDFMTTRTGVSPKTGIVPSIFPASTDKVNTRGQRLSMLLCLSCVLFINLIYAVHTSQLIVDFVKLFTHLLVQMGILIEK